MLDLLEVFLENALGMDYLRPEDYYAEMLKSDEHMTRVKESECRPQSEPSDAPAH